MINPCVIDCFHQDESDFHNKVKILSAVFVANGPTHNARPKGAVICVSMGCRYCRGVGAAENTAHIIIYNPVSDSKRTISKLSDKVTVLYAGQVNESVQLHVIDSHKTITQVSCA